MSVSASAIECTYDDACNEARAEVDPGGRTLHCAAAHALYSYSCRLIIEAHATATTHDTHT
eukprot:COSAG01_NODE_7919_length_2992_cov_4.821984_5_plen_61_part_00